jgi:uncharacterized protein
MTSVFSKRELHGIVCDMIPQFPEFKPLALQDWQTIEQFTNPYPPYSDFDFTSMYMWNTAGKIRVSELNGNLVVQFADYLTGEPFFSFIGENLPDETAIKIMEYASQIGISATLKLVPEIIADKLNQSLFEIIEDRDSFDYIYDTYEHSQFAGGDYANKRKEVNVIERSHPDVETKMLDLSDKNIRQELSDMYNKWADNKLNESKTIEKNEEISFLRLINLIQFEPNGLSCIGIFAGGVLMAFCIYELMDTEYAVGHTAKSDATFKGANAYLMKQTGLKLHEVGKKYFNYEQDLGLANLRTAKERFRPKFFLKKYSVSLL